MEDQARLSRDAIEKMDRATLRSWIDELEKQKERREDKIGRVQQELREQNGEFAARKEELQRLKKELAEQQAEARQAAEFGSTTKGPAAGNPLKLLVRDDPNAVRDVQDKVRTCVEQQLEDALKKKQTSKKNDVGIRMFDEMELMVDKPRELQEKEGKSIDTVMVVFVKNSEARSYLSYRVDSSKRIQELLQDACLYWGLSEVEYVLKTQQGSKVHDNMKIQNCFRKDEQALLTLIQKNPKQTRLQPEEVEAINKRGKKKKEHRGPVVGTEEQHEGHHNHHHHNQAEEQVEEEELEQQMISKKVYGLYEFLTQWRDQAVTAHLEHIRLRNIIVYFLMALLLIISLLTIHVPQESYFCREGLIGAMTEERVVHVGDLAIDVTKFTDIRSYEEAWNWIKYIVSYNLLSDTSDFRQSNYAPGYVQVRMQMVKVASVDQCQHKGEIGAGIQCVAETYSEDTARTSTFEGLQTYWTSVSDEAGRDGDPATFLRVDDANSTVWFEGSHQSYDPSGYTVRYNMQHVPLPDTYQAYLDDMNVIRSYWLNNLTRAVHVNFVAYNGNYDYWITNHFLLEMPANGIVETNVDSELYRPVVADSLVGVENMALDTLLLILAVLYMGVSQPYHHNNVAQRDFRHFQRKKDDIDALKKKAQVRPEEFLKKEDLSLYKFDPPWFKVGIKYGDGDKRPSFRQTLLTANNIIDISICVIYVVLYCLRYFGPLISFGNTLKYRSSAKLPGFATDTHSDHFRMAAILQSVVIALVLWRWYGFLKLNRFMFLIFRTISAAIQTYSRFGLVLLPVMAGFSLLAHHIFRSYTKEYRTFWSSVTAYLVLLIGNKESVYVLDVMRPMSIVFFFGNYIIVKLVLFHSWVASLVQTFQRVRVTCGYKPDDKSGPYYWKEDKYVDLFLYPKAKRVYWFLRCRRDHKAKT